MSLTAMLLMTYGIGASMGPLAAGILMKLFGSHMLYAFFGFFALILVWRIRPKAVTNLHQVEDAPLQHVVMPEAMSPLGAALDPRVDEQIVLDQMCDGVASPASAPEMVGEVDESDPEPAHKSSN